MAAITAVGASVHTTVRSAELDRLERAVASARRGRPAVVEVAADPGMGKTRLLTALARRAEDQGVRVLRGRCTEAATAYRPILQALSMWEPPDDTGAPASPATALIRTLVDGPGTDIADFGRRCHFYAGVRRLWGLSLADAPAGLLLVLDDYHWADAGTAELLEVLTHWPVDGGLAVIVAHRPRQIPPQVRGTLQEGVERGAVDLVELPGLTLDQTAELLDDGPHTAPEQQLPYASHRVRPQPPGHEPHGTQLREPALSSHSPEMRRLHHIGAGNPLYVLALAAARDSGATGTQDVWAHAVRHLDVRLHSETGRLDTATRTVLHAAAVLGEGFSVDAVAQVAAVSRDAACATLGELRRRDLLRPTGAPGLLSFRHPLLRSGLYERMDACWRAGAHRRALSCLRTLGTPAIELAPHVERAGASATPADREILTSAARTALHLGEPSAAAHWLTVAMRLERTLGAPGLPADPPELWQQVVQALAASGDANGVNLLVREILPAQAGATAAERATTVAYLSGVMAALGRDDAAQGLIAAELSATGAFDHAAVALLQVQQQVSKVLAGQVPARADIEALVRRTRDGEPVTAAGALALRGLCAVVAGDTCSAEWSLVAAAQALDELDDGTRASDQENPLLLVLSWAEALMGWYGPAHGHAERALSSVRERGDTHLLPPLLDTLGYVHYQSGRMPEALAMARECRETADAAGRADHVGLSDAIVAAAWAQLGRINPQVRSCRPARASATGEPAAEPRTPLNALLLAEALLAGGDGSAALALLLPRREAWRVSEPVAVLAARGYELLAAAALAAGDDRVGLDVSDIDEWAAHAVDAARAVGIAEQTGHALLARGHALASRRQHTEAARAYEEAMELLGAESPSGARARELARAVGHDPVGGTDGAFAELTLREKEVAALAGEGHKTREIAERLMVSPRTVDAHITRIYSKLGVSSRAELARLVALAG
ncbi:AAA family ATPase [Streptomyces sp. NPDC005953]|uniref:ATP-binding protein n=1 Tax=Streptomyces sp. NPDC005953 TaxID=3156719 RepID=UPI003410ECA1